jgi:hypothetical protein
MMDTLKRVLVLYWYEGSEKSMRAAIHHHLRTLDHSGGALREVLYCNAFRGIPASIPFQEFDGIILHNTLLCLRWSHLFEICRWRLRWIGTSKCVKIALSQDEYDHSEILDEWLSELGVAIIFTNFGVAHRKSLYPIMHKKAQFYECFTGYLNEEVARQYESRLAEPASRPYDIVYRATYLPYWFGSHGQLKHQIADIVAKRAGSHHLRCDISTRVEDTIVGDCWLDFLASGRAVIGCESGSSVLDRRGEIRTRIQAMLRQDRTLSFEEVNKRLPKGWDDHRFFAISPRHFEAVITKTCQILVEGNYDGVLEADKHYIPLKRDFSNINDVLEKIKNTCYVQTMVEQAYRDICMSGKYTYMKFAEDIEIALSRKTIGKQVSIEVEHQCEPNSLARGSAYPYLSVFSALAHYYLYPGKAILNKPLKPFLKKCFQFLRNQD